jgi:protoporphyrinogen oxidase
MSKIAIIGTGISAFGAANQLAGEKLDVTLYDKNSFHAGHTVSLKYKEGFTFDIGPHVSFTSDERIQKMLAEAVDGEYDTHDYKFNNYWKGAWLGHPAQTNLYGLPPEVIVNVITDFVEQGSRQVDIKNYEDWLLAAYGKTFAEQFPGQYTFKYHTTPASNLTTDWMGPRMYRPKLEEMLYGALSAETPNVHYIQKFRYPRQGGFEAYLTKWARASHLELNHQVERIDPKMRTLSFKNGKITKYDALISSVPLPELVKLIVGTPANVAAAAARLACSACVLVNIGISRDDFANTHIDYFYDLDIVFPRTSYPHMMAKSNAPPGCGSIQVEVYFSPKYRPFTGKAEDYIEPVLRDLKRCGVIEESDQILLKEAVYIPYANIIFDHDRTEALKIVRDYLDDIGIETCGRYGEWGYFWTDDSIKSGEGAAQRTLARLGG